MGSKRCMMWGSRCVQACSRGGSHTGLQSRSDRGHATPCLLPSFLYPSGMPPRSGTEPMMTDFTDELTSGGKHAHKTLCNRDMPLTMLPAISPH